MLEGKSSSKGFGGGAVAGEGESMFSENSVRMIGTAVECEHQFGCSVAGGDVLVVVVVVASST